MKTELTIEQSAKLIELGVDKMLASMKEFVPIHPKVLKGNAEYAKPWGWMPKFTLTNLLAILPKEIKGYQLNIVATLKGYSADYSLYDDEIADIDVIDDGAGDFSAPELIDSLYQLLIWTIENNYVKLNTEKK